MLKCSFCKQEKTEDLFWKNSSIRRGYSYICKDCQNKEYKGRDKEKYNKWAREYRRKQKNKEYEKAFRKKYLTSLNGYVSKLLSGAKNRALKNNIEFDLDNQWLFDKLKEEKCSVTGLTLSFEKSKEYRINPLSPSLDRINSDKGYTKENTRIVCWIYNLSKADYDDNVVLQFAKALVNNS